MKLERICTDILMDMTGEIQIHQGQPFQPYQLVRKSMVNILSSLVSIMSIIQSTPVRCPINLSLQGKELLSSLTRLNFLTKTA